MKSKRVFYTEAAYIIGIAVLALGTAFMERADFGMSMVVAPAYLLHLKVSQCFPVFSFGMAEYTFQALLLVILSLSLRKVRISYLFSFVTAVVYGFALDGAIFLAGFLPSLSIWGRAACFISGMLMCSLGVAFLFHTYISPEAYELFVKEISDERGAGISTVKTVYDCASCLLGIIMSFAFFGMWHFEGVKTGTVFCALVNGFVIGKCSAALESKLEFKDGLKLRKLFEK